MLISLHVFTIHTDRISIIVKLLDHFPDVLRNSGVLSVFGTHVHTLLQHLRRFLDVFLRIAHNRMVKEDNSSNLTEQRDIRSITEET